MEKANTLKRSSNFSGYHLFTEEYFKKNKKEKRKGKRKGNAPKERMSFQGVSLEVRDAWNRLSDKERGEYTKRATEIRGPRKGKMYVVPFHTRCAPKQFITVCEKIKTRPDLIERLKAIGFDKLVDVGCTQINRDLCAKFMRCFDPGRKVVTIRGESRVIAPTDVEEIMGLPHGGQKIELNVDDNDHIFVDLCTVYKGLAYQNIGEWLIGDSDDNFELYFVIFALGTLLTPSSSIYVSKRILKCLTLTQNRINAFDWCSFIVTELCEAVAGYQRQLLKGSGQERKTVGGCLYFLMIFCLQNFPLGNVVARVQEQAISFWNDDRIKRRIGIEKESMIGLLHIDQGGGVQANTPFNPETMLTHPEIRRTYFSIIGMVGAELLELQQRLEAKEREDQRYEDETGGAGPSGPAQAEAESDDDIGESDDDVAEAMDDQLAHDDVAEAMDEHPAEKDVDEGGKLQIVETQEENIGYDGLRRSQRTKTPSWVVSSPFINQKLKQRGKHQFDAEERLFELCTQRPKEEEGDEIFIEMHDYYVTRAELYCLRPKGWLNDTVMSMVAKALVAEQLEKDGRVTRHVFTPHFMSKLVDNPSTWRLEDNETQILPEHVGYNIGDCDFIFGPTIFLDHWSCYVLHTHTMRFYALDSLADQGVEDSTKKKRKKAKWTDPKQHIANKTRECFFQILEKLKPELVHRSDNIDKDVTWPKVHLQRDLDSCGVHVLSWIQMWDGTEGDDGYTMPYHSAVELQQLKSGVLWWLVNNPTNKHRQKVMDLLEGFSRMKRVK